jgi:hypothetical protein
MFAGNADVAELFSYAKCPHPVTTDKKKKG